MIRKTFFKLFVLGSIFVSMASCNEEIKGSLTFYTDGGSLLYHKKDEATLKTVDESLYTTTEDGGYKFDGIAKNPLPDEVIYLSSAKDGYTFLGWNAKVGDKVSSSNQSFKEGSTFPYGAASYVAHFEKNVQLTFKAVRQRYVADTTQYTASEQWELNSSGIDDYVVSTYVTKNFNSSDISSIISYFNEQLSTSSNGWNSQGSFTQVKSSADLETAKNVSSITVSEDQLVYYVLFEENPSITYVYPDGTQETKYATDVHYSLSDTELQPSLMEPESVSSPNSRFIGWYEGTGTDKKKINFDESFSTNSQIKLTGAHVAYPEFESPLNVSLSVDENAWTYESSQSLPLMFANETYEVNSLGLGNPVSKITGVAFDFWYLDVDGDGSYGNEDIKLIEGSSFVAPSGMGSYVIRPCSTDLPVLTLDITGIEEYWDFDKLSEYGFTVTTETVSNVTNTYLKKYCSKNEVLWSPSDDTVGTIGLQRMKEAVIDSDLFNLSGFELSSTYLEVPYSIDSLGFSIKPAYIEKRRFFLYYATDVTSDGVVTYSNTPVTKLLQVGFSSSFAGDDNLHGIDANASYPATGDADFYEYAQWGWTSSSASTDAMQIFISEKTSNYVVGDSTVGTSLYAYFKKKVSLGLTYGDQTAKLYGFVGEEISPVDLCKAFNDNTKAFWVYEEKQILVGEQYMTYKSPVTQYPETNGSYSVDALTTN